MKNKFVFLIFLLINVYVSAQQKQNWNDIIFFTKDTTFSKPIEPEKGATALEKLKVLCNNKESWQNRRSCLEQGIKKALLLPENRKPTVPKAVFSQKEAMDGYTVENVAIEVMPGLWTTGNLYRPLNRIKKHPAILSAQGHGQPAPSDFCARFSKSSQTMCAMLAKMGAIVYNYDMFGIGESGLHAGYTIHRTGLAQSVQTLSSIRIIDFLSSLKDVDNKHIGMTGASGGGTQTLLATAIDPRIAVSVPVVQVSSFFPGGCPCESGRPIHLMCNPISNNAEIAAMAAPRPMLVISDGSDWTQTVDKVEYPFIKHLYSFYRKDNQVKNVHLINEKHDYGLSKRIAMYDFMAKHLKLNNTIVKNAKGKYDESIIKTMKWEKLLVFPNGKLPEGHLKNAKEIYYALISLTK